MDTKNRNKSIENNLKDFYFSFKKGSDVSFYENEFLKSIHTSWPSFVLLKEDDIPFKKVINSVKKEEKLSKNWILDENYVKNYQKLIKNEKLFPLKSWENMHLFIDKLIDVKSIPDFKIEALQLEDLDEFKPNQSKIIDEKIESDYIALTQNPRYAEDPRRNDESKR